MITKIEISREKALEILQLASMTLGHSSYIRATLAKRIYYYLGGKLDYRRGKRVVNKNVVKIERRE